VHAGIDASPTTKVSDRWRPSGTLAAIVLIALAGRAALLGQVMRHDEAVTYGRFAGTFATALTDYSAPNNHIVHTILVHLSTRVLGGAPWAIRIPSFVFGVLLVIAVHWWISSAVSEEAALMAAALTAGSFFLIEYSTIARGYTMVATGFVVLLELSRRILAHGGRRRRWITWVVVAVLGMATVPVFAYPLAFVTTWIAFSIVFDRAAESRSKLSLALGSSVAAVAILSVVFYLPATLNSGVAAIVDNDFIQPIARSHLLEEWKRLWGSLLDVLAEDGWVALFYPPLVVVAMIDRRHALGRPITPTVGLLGVIVIMAVQAVSPPTRVLLFGWPLVFGLAGAGTHVLTARSQWLAHRPLAVPAMAVALAAIMTAGVVASGDVLRSREAGTFRDGPEAADLLLDVIGPGDRIVAESHPRQVLEYYLRRRGWAGPELQRDYQNADRLFVVVYHPRPQDLSDVLARVPVTDFRTPQLLTSLDETDVYVMERASPSAVPTGTPLMGMDHLVFVQDGSEPPTGQHLFAQSVRALGLDGAPVGR
jgi:hypothetical protein